jgi:hypothetical protein
VEVSNISVRDDQVSRHINDLVESHSGVMHRIQGRGCCFASGCPAERSGSQMPLFRQPEGSADVHDSDTFWEDEERLNLQGGQPLGTDSNHGVLISVTSLQLFLRNADGCEDAYTLGADVKLTIDGKPCRADELVVGRNVLVTRKTGDACVTTLIDMLRPEEPLADVSQLQQPV